MILRISLFAITAFSLSGCGTRALSRGAHLGMVQANEKMYRQRAIEFVGYARTGELGKLMLYTSVLTIKIQGEDQVRTTYKEKVIPAFVDATISWDSDAKLIYDHRSNPGFSYSGSIINKQRSRFSIAIFGEEGEYVVAGISRPNQHQKSSP